MGFWIALFSHLRHCITVAWRYFAAEQIHRYIHKLYPDPLGTGIKHNIDCEIRAQNREHVNSTMRRTDFRYRGKKAFYEQFSVVREKVPKGDVVITIGDPNIKLGSSNTLLDN